MKTVSFLTVIMIKTWMKRKTKRMKGGRKGKKKERKEQKEQELNVVDDDHHHHCNIDEREERKVNLMEMSR